MGGKRRRVQKGYLGDYLRFQDFSRFLKITPSEYPPFLHPPQSPTPKTPPKNPNQSLTDPSAGSPTETLLRLLLPLNDKVQPTSPNRAAVASCAAAIRSFHRTIQSVGATGGVYKGQGRNQRRLMTYAY